MHPQRLDKPLEVHIFLWQGIEHHKHRIHGSNPYLGPPNPSEKFVQCNIYVNKV